MIGENLTILAVILGVIVSAYTIKNNLKKDQYERAQEQKNHERRHEQVEQRIKALEEGMRLIQLDHSLLKEDTKVLIAMQEQISTLFKSTERVENKIDLLVETMLQKKGER